MPSANDEPVPYDRVPATPAELAECLADPMWRICSGQLYKIIIKSNEQDEGKVAPFRPNRAQRRFIARLWHRNIILKARQLGFTTLICILWLDHALFNADQRCGIIAQNRETAEALFRDKVRFAYNNLPEQVRAARPLARESATELLFSNNSAIRVATSLRGFTPDRLHISEFGKICAEFPAKAAEIVTGSIPAVPLDGITVIESTAEGQDGAFHDMTMLAMATHDLGRELTPREYRFHFFPWWGEPGYRIDSTHVVITPKDEEYFAEVEAATGTELDQHQRNWYAATRDADFAGDPEKMWQEYPSTALEAFKVSTEGTYYATQLAAARKSGRIGNVPYVPGVPVNTFWDIGAGDGTAIWFHQQVGLEHRLIDFEEGHGEPYAEFIRRMQAKGYTWGTHYLPHDAEHHRQQAEKVVAPIDELRGFALGGSWDSVERVDHVIHGIQAVRKIFPQLYIDQTRCAAGLVHLAQYRKTWNKSLGCWTETPRHDIHSEAADALRQLGQKFDAVRVSTAPKRERRARSWRTA